MTHSPAFRRLLTAAARGEVVVPVLRAKLWSPDFKSFDVTVAGFEERPWDGWFHPSTHPLWPDRMLWWYLTAPEKLVREPFDPTSTMAITQGHFWHILVQHIGVTDGFLRDPGVCGCGCGRREWFAADDETRSRGHVDGILNGARLGLEGDEIFEFKTMIPGKLARLEKGNPADPAVVASFRALCPDYYAQAQEYLRIFGYARWRGVILGLTYPFEFREVAMDRDDLFMHTVRTKYRRVLAAAEAGAMPEACCHPRSAQARGCPARAVCPVGKC